MARMEKLVLSNLEGMDFVLVQFQEVKLPAAVPNIILHSSTLDVIKSDVTVRLDAGAQNWATLESIIETCKLNKVEPHAYLTGLLAAIAQGHKRKGFVQLLPWIFGR
jgi:hypothetical protein